MTDACKDCAKGRCDRWDHLIETVRFRSFSATVTAGTWKWFQVGSDGTAREVPVRIVEPVDRCDCGGVFGPDPGGKTICGCCGAPKSFAVKVSPEAETGRTLREQLIERRRQPRHVASTPTDDDVKVTVP